jgi:mono/diheme cytochrome c family protein
MPAPAKPSVLRTLRLSVLAGLVVGAGFAPVWATSNAGLSGPATPAELATARDDFVTWCSGCHGEDGKGRGPVAIELKAKPADLTGIARRNGGSFDREQVYKKIEGLDMPASHGTSEMPVWGAWFVHQAVGEGVLIEDARTAAKEATQRINNLVKYLESLQQ